MKNFANIISQKRKELGLTQDALAEKLGITPQAVSKWENGVGLPDVTLFPAIAKVLGVSTDALFGIDHTQKERSPMEFPAEYEGLAFIGCENGIACYSDKTLERHEDGIFFFTDGSSAHMDKEHEILNCGKGEIFLLHEENIPHSRPGIQTSLEKELSPFSSLSVELSACDFKLVRADAFRIEAQGSAHFIEKLQLKENGDQLSLVLQQSNDSRNNEENHITLYVPFDLGKKLTFALNGSSDVTIEPDFEEMNLSINGSGNITAQNANTVKGAINGSGELTFLAAKKVSLSVNGSGNISALRSEENTTIKITGSGDIDIKEAANTTVKIIGSGDVNIGKAGGDMNINILGSGDVTAAGAVEEFKCEITGSGDFNGSKLSVMNAELRITEQSVGEITIGRIKGISRERISKEGTLRVHKRG